VETYLLWTNLGFDDLVLSASFYLFYTLIKHDSGKTFKELALIVGNMAGFLGKAPLTSDIALFLEIAIIVALFVGRFKFARNRRFRAHGLTVTAAVGLHALTILLVMIPRFVVSLDLLFTDFFSPTIIITWIHAPLGLAVLILGVYLVSIWRFQPPDATCYKRARLMRPLWLLWMFNLVLGLLIYVAFALFG
jgi:hypothetical protein